MRKKIAANGFLSIIDDVLDITYLRDKRNPLLNLLKISSGTTLCGIHYRIDLLCKYQLYYFKINILYVLYNLFA